MLVLQALAAAVAISILYCIALIVYRIYLHPLSRYPGPKLAAASEIWYVWAFLGGYFAQDIREAHIRYGSIVRIAPNDLSFNTPESTRDIYYHVVNGRPKLLKGAAYERPEMPSVATVQDPDEHRIQRASMSQAFSLKTIRAKQPRVFRYVDRFIQEMHKLATRPEGINMVEAYNWIAFDIMGDLTFSKDLGGLRHDQKTNYWIMILFDSVLWGLSPNLFARMPLLSWIYPLVFPKGVADKRATHSRYTRELVRERLSMKFDQDPDDLFDVIVRRKGVSEDEMVSQAMILLAAGSGTVQSALSGATYYLLSNPSTLSKLQNEVRSRFKTPQDVTDESAAGLTYLHGVIQETLRMFPPVPSRLPRVSPGTNIDGEFIPDGAIVASHTYNMSRDPEYWADPDSFHPERWLVGSEAGDRFKRDRKEATKPFSTGPRACLGVNLAYMEVRIILARLVLAFDWELLPESQNWEKEMKMLFLWKKKPLKVRMHAVSRASEPCSKIA